METKLCSFRDQAVAGMIEDILRQSGIHVRPLATAGHAFVAGADQWYDQWVPTEEETRAREIFTASGYQGTLGTE